MRFRVDITADLSKRITEAEARAVALGIASHVGWHEDQTHWGLDQRRRRMHLTTVVMVDIEGASIEQEREAVTDIFGRCWKGALKASGVSGKVDMYLVTPLFNWRRGVNYARRAPELGGPEIEEHGTQ